jgi:hypothetical protein
MAGAVWPNGEALFEFVGGQPDARERWENAVVQALDDLHSLQLTPQGGDYYDLIGTCPRCGHHMKQSLEFSTLRAKDMIVGIASDSTPATTFQSAREAAFDIVCSCREPHDGRDADTLGCGWGRGLRVTLNLDRDLPSASAGSPT